MDYLHRVLDFEANHCCCASLVHGQECCGYLVGSQGLSLLGHSWLERTEVVQNRAELVPMQAGVLPGFPEDRRQVKGRWMPVVPEDTSPFYLGSGNAWPGWEVEK